MNCILLSALIAIGQNQCHKIHAELESLDMNYRRGGVWVRCYNPQTWDYMYFGELEIKAKCIQLK
jgi:hypothetical protein